MGVAGGKVKKGKRPLTAGSVMRLSSGLRVAFGAVVASVLYTQGGERPIQNS
jgi:hypothetical protein